MLLLLLLLLLRVLPSALYSLEEKIPKLMPLVESEACTMRIYSLGYSMNISVYKEHDHLLPVLAAPLFISAGFKN